MTFTEIVNAAAERLDLTSNEALARLGRHVNLHYKRITSSIGLQTSRRTIVQANATIGVQTITFTGIEKIHRVEDRSSGSTRILDEVSNEEIADRPLGDGLPTKYAIYSTTGTSVTIKLNVTPQTAFTLYAEGLANASTLSGTDVPAFGESFHDVLVSGAVYEERLKQEKPQLAAIARSEYEDRLGDLRLFIAKTAQQDIYQGKRPGALSSSLSGGSGSGTPNGAASYTQTGLITFDRTSAAPGSRNPFAVQAGSEKVANLDADKLDGLDSTAFVQTGSVNAVPTSPNDATKFLNGATTPAFAQVKDSDLSTSDIATNNVSSTKHGFAPKSPADATQFLNGAATPAFAAVKDSDLSTSDITTNNVTTSKHGFIAKAPNDTAQFFRGDASWAVAFPQITQGRLTLTSGTPVTSSDVTGATSIYFTPYGGNRVALYTNSLWQLYTFTEKTLALGTLTNDLPYDVFLYDNSGTLTLEAVAWTNKTTRATALTTQDGVLVKSGSTNKKYLGTFHTTSTTTTEDSLAKRLLWNYYNRVPRSMRVLETTDTWTYTTATFRQARASTANQIAFVIGWNEVEVSANVAAIIENSGTAAAVTVAVGALDSTSTPTGLFGRVSITVASSQYSVSASHREIPAVGYHFFAWLEYSTASGTTTWKGDNGSGATEQSGIYGSLMG